MGRYFCTALLAAGLIGCQSLPPREVPVSKPVYIDCYPDESDMPTRPEWLFLPAEVGGLQRVKELGGTNRDLYYVAVRDSEAARTANTRLGIAERYTNELEELIRGGCPEPR